MMFCALSKAKGMIIKMNKEYFLFVNGKKIKVSEEIYKRIFQNIECLNPLRYLGLRHFLCFRCMARTSPPEV